MITVSVVQSGDTIHAIDIEGHAGSAAHGKDLICAGVSSIAVGTLNALDMLVKDTCCCEMQKGCIHIEVSSHDQAQTQLILRTMLIQLETMQERYHQYIQIQIQEV